MTFTRGPYLYMASWSGNRLPVPGTDRRELWPRAYRAWLRANGGRSR